MSNGLDTFYRRVCIASGKCTARTPRSTDRVLTPDFALSYPHVFGLGGQHVQQFQTRVLSVRAGIHLYRGVWR